MNFWWLFIICRSVDIERLPLSSYGLARICNTVQNCTFRWPAEKGHESFYRVSAKQCVLELLRRGTMQEHLQASVLIVLSAIKARPLYGYLQFLEPTSQTTRGHLTQDRNTQVTKMADETAVIRVRTFNFSRMPSSVRPCVLWRCVTTHDIIGGTTPPKNLQTEAQYLHQ
jgi:hypothetical protein